MSVFIVSCPSVSLNTTHDAIPTTMPRLTKYTSRWVTTAFNVLECLTLWIGKFFR